MSTRDRPVSGVESEERIGCIFESQKGRLQ